VTGQWKSIVQRKILRVGKRVSCPKTGGLVLTVYTRFLHMELAFEGRSDCTIAPPLKFLVALIFYSLLILKRVSAFYWWVTLITLERNGVTDVFISFSSPPHGPCSDTCLLAADRDQK